MSRTLLVDGQSDEVFDAVASLLQVGVALSASYCALFAFVSLPIIMPTMTKPSYPPSAVQKECQRVIHFIAHNSVFKMEDLTDEQKKAKLFSLVHGPEDPQTSHLAKFCLENALRNWLALSRTPQSTVGLQGKFIAQSRAGRWV